MYQEYIRREGECRTPYCRVQTPFEEYRGQVTQYYTLTYHKRLARKPLVCAWLQCVNCARAMICTVFFAQPRGAMATTTPVRRSPRLLARLLSQPATLLQRGSATTTPARKKRLLQHDSATSKEVEGPPATK